MQTTLTVNLAKRAALLWLLLSTLNPQLSTLFAQGTDFTYQGRLLIGTNGANGSYDLSFALFSVSSGAGQLGGTQTNLATSISNGLFTVALNFGTNFPGADRWLEIAARTNGPGAFTPLSPRQKITPMPYAIYSAKAGSAATVTGVVPATNLTGTLLDAQLSGNVALLNRSPQSFSGANNFLGNVGIGTASPQSTLDVNGNLRVRGPIVVDADQVNTNGAYDKGLLFGTVSGEGIVSKRSFAGGGNGYGLDFYTSAQKRMSIANGGNVGIGTITPLAQFNVDGNARVDAVSSGYAEGLSLNLPTDMAGGGYGGIHFHNAGRGSNYTSETIKWSIFYNNTPGGGLAIIQNNASTRLLLRTNGTTQIPGLVIENRTSDPPAPASGQIWLRTDL